MKKFLIIFCLILLFLGCNSSKKEEIYYSKYIPNYELKEIDSTVYYNNDTLFISQTGDMDVWNNYILISDFNFNKLWVFDKNLNLINTIGGKGRGPGEFSYPPIILTDTNKIYLFNMKFRLVNVYDDSFKFMNTFSLPKEVEFPSYKPVKVGTGYIFFVIYPYPISDVKYYKKYKSLVFLDNNFKYVKDILTWDNVYIKRSGYALDNVKVLLTGNNDSFFAMQIASLKINHIDKNFNNLKVFGLKPKYFKEPPDIKFEDIQKNLESVLNFSANTTAFLKILYDNTNNNLLVNYANLDKDFFYNRTLLLGKHYLQIYNKNYDCIFDGEIPGKLAFVSDGKIYILTDERPEYIKFKIFRLEKN